MAAAWKTVRVFISSTFRDMHAERDWLVKRVFPALRERLQQYRIHLVDIDLRWGITEEEAQHDRVLDLCLHEIDECRPFFVGILGERYGWVPGSFSEEAASKYGWVQYQTGKSVTELEIVYGVLRDPKMHGHGIFFFRDPTFIADLPDAKRDDFRAEDEESTRKLAALKQAIRDAGLPCPPLENYPCRYAGLRINCRLVSNELTGHPDWEALRKVAEDGIVDPEEYGRLSEYQRELAHRFGVVHLTALEEFGRQVSEQLWRAIQDEHHLPETPPVVSLAETDPLAEEADYHEQFMESRLRVYVGRQEIHDQLTAFADGEATCPCLVTGPSGCGKSAVLARFARSYAENYADVLVIPHFVGASPGSTDLRQMLRRFCLILQQRFGPVDEVPQDVPGLVSHFRQVLDSVPENARVVLLIDALNQLDEAGNAHSLYWLPWKLPPQVKLLLSCIDESIWYTPGAEPSGTRSVPDTMDEAVLKALTPRPLERLEVHPLTGEERLEIVSRVPSMSAKKLDPKQIGLLLGNPATQTPLFLLVAMEELRGFGLYEHVNSRIAAFPREGGDPVGTLFGQVIERLQGEFDPEVVCAVLALIACSRIGISQREMLEMIEGIGVEESTTDLFPVLRQIRPYLQYRGELLDYFHRGLYRAVENIHLSDRSRRQAWHNHLAVYFRKKADPGSDAPWQSGHSRGLSELPYQLSSAGEDDQLHEILRSVPYLHERCRLTGVYELIEDFFAFAPQQSGTPRQCAAYETLLRRHAHRLSRFPDLLFSLVYHEGFPIARDQALDLLRHRQWKRPWLRFEKMSVSRAGQPSEETGLEVEIVSKVDFEYAGLSCVARDVSVAYVMVGLGRLAVVDLHRGRRLFVEIPVRKRRILRMVCSPDGHFLAIAYDDGRGEILTAAIDLRTQRLTHSHQADFLYLLPRHEAPVLACIENRVWYQNSSGQIAWLSLGAEESQCGVLQTPVVEPGCELSGLAALGNRLVMTLRKGGEGIVIVSQPDEGTWIHSHGHRDVTALCPFGVDHIALACSNAKTAIYRISRAVEETASFSTGETTLAMAASGGVLVGVTEMGSVWSSEVLASPPSPRLAPTSRAFLQPVSLQAGPDGSFILSGATGVTTFRLGTSAVTSAYQLYDVFPMPAVDDVLLIRQQEGTAWLVRLGHPDPVPLTGEQDVLWSVAYDRKSRRFLACTFGGRALMVDVEQMKRDEAFSLPAQCRCTADLHGGFWLFAPPSELCYLDFSGRYVKRAELPLEIAGPVQVHCWNEEHPILSVKAACRVESKTGTDVLHTLCFYRIIRRMWGCPALEKIAVWSIPSEYGEPESWCYLPALEQFLVKLGSHFHLASARDLGTGREQVFFVPEMLESCYRATAGPNASSVFFLGTAGNLYLLDAAARKVKTAYSGTASVTQMSACADHGLLYVVVNRIQLGSCRFEKGGE